MSADQPTTIQPPAPPAISLGAHPRAARSIRRLRAGAGLVALVLVALLSARAGAPLFDAVARGLAGGMAAHLAAWLCGMVAWRHIALAELDGARRRAAERAAAERAPSA